MSGGMDKDRGDHDHMYCAMRISRERLKARCDELTLELDASHARVKELEDANKALLLQLEALEKIRCIRKFFDPIRRK